MNDERDDFYEEDYEDYEDDGRSGFFAAVVLVMMVILMMIAVGMISYDIGRHQLLTSEEAREIGRELVYDARIKNGDVIEKSYMPEGGFTFDSDTMMLSEFYKDTTNLDGTFYIYSNDGEFLRHFQDKYPEALYPSNEWTPEEVLEFYYESPESWAYYDSVYLGMGYFICLTPDYKHCFAVKDDKYNYGDEMATMGWLIIDGVYVTVIDEQTADSLDPQVLIARYRDGTWNGDLLRSSDYATTVTMSYDRTGLSYYYQKNVYTPEQDPLGLAYDGYEDPWWYDEELAEKYGVESSREWICDFGYESTMRLKCYPDLPDDFEKERIVETENLMSSALDVLLDDGHLQRYSRIELLDEWDLSGMTRITLDDDVMCYVRKPFGLNDEIYYLDDGKLFALKAGGEASVMLDHIDAIDRGYSLRGSTIFVLENGGLYGYDMYEGVVYMVDRDVLELNFDRIMAYKKADGYHTLYRVRNDNGPDYGTLYLGEESLDYYIEYRKNLDSASWYN